MIIIVGPTASGKTRLSVEIAKMGRGEIVSADSRQVFRDMEIGTAKPTELEMQGVVHHCINIKNPDESFSAGEYGKLARKCVSEILSRQHLPVVVGGSGLYIQALIDGMFPDESKDTDLREALKEEIKNRGLDALYLRLKSVDPEAAEKIHSNDQKRILRAIEVYEITGRPISMIQKENTRSAGFAARFWGLRWPRAVLYRRIDQRVDAMLEKGLVGEVKALKAKGWDTRLNALDSVGYKEIFAYLRGEIEYEEAVELIKRNTRRFAKKQLIWFRKDTRIQWIDMEEPVDWTGMAECILADLETMA